MLRSTSLALSLILAAGVAEAQTDRPATPRETQPPVLPSPQPAPIPEKIRPSEPSTTGSTLSDKLERSEGVIRPPAGIAPDMSVPAPAPNPGTTPVIPPPGSPGGDQSINPK